MTRHLLTVLLVCMGAAAVDSAAHALNEQQAEPPSIEVLTERTNTWMEWYRGADSEERTQENMASKLDEVLEGLDLSELTIEGVQHLNRFTSFAPDVRAKLNERLDTLKGEETPGGAVAAHLVLQSNADTATFVEQAQYLFNHPGYEEAMRTGQLAGLLDGVQSFPEDAVKPLLAHIIGMAELIEPSVSPAVLGAAARYAVALHEFDDVISETQRDTVRTQVRDVIQARIEALRQSEEDNSNTEDWLGRQVTMLESNYGKGKLLNSPAPELYFDWSSDDSLRTLDDLKGKVVILDYWATWCGPCIATFPNIRKLVSHYEGYDVAVIGVTSLQGRHYPGGGEAPIDVEGDPDREHELMKEFMNAKEMTWTVAFSRQDVFNPEYGVRGIPHVAILDPQGNVRFNGLHPGGPLEDKFAKINDLLTEAGLKVPSAPDAESVDE